MAKKVIDPKEIFVMAETMQDACLLISPQVKLEPRFYTAFAMNAAFAIELYFKTLICLQAGKNPPRGHNLLQLFNCLNASNKASVEAEGFAYFKRVAGGLILRRDTGKPSTFAEIVESASNEFINMRYLFEADAPPDGSFFGVVIEEGLRITILKQKPEWTALCPTPASFKPQFEMTSVQAGPELNAKMISLNWGISIAAAETTGGSGIGSSVFLSGNGT